jgi:CBS domain-containing protein
MKRVNIREAFVGEPNPGSDGLTGLRRLAGTLEAGQAAAAASEVGQQEELEEDDGLEALLLAVRGGELTVVVPAGADEQRAAEVASCLRGVLRLENERVLTFEIQDGATGAFFDDEPAALHRRQVREGSADLSAIAPGHDYMAAPLVAAPGVAHQLMTPAPITARPGLTTREVAALLLYHRISGLPVLDDGGQLVGVVSEADLIGKPGATGEDATVGDVMSRPAVAVDVATPIDEVAATMARAGIKRVPVLREGALVGIISRADIVRWVAGAGQPA